MEKWATGVDSLRRLEVKTNNHLASSQSLFSQKRWNHAAVTINKRIIILGGKESMKTGEIVGDGEAQIGNLHFHYLL